MCNHDSGDLGVTLKDRVDSIGKRKPVGDGDVRAAEVRDLLYSDPRDLLELWDCAYDLLAKQRTGLLIGEARGGSAFT